MTKCEIANSKGKGTMPEDTKTNDPNLIAKEIDLIFENKILKHKVDITEKRNKHILTFGGIVFLISGLLSYIQLDSKVDTAITKLNHKGEELARQVADDRSKMNDLLNEIRKSYQKAEISCLSENKELANAEISFGLPNEIRYIMFHNTGSKAIQRAKVDLYIQDKVLPSLKPDHPWQPVIPSDKENYSRYFYNLEERLYSITFLSPNEKTPLPLKFITGMSPFGQTLDAILIIYFEDDSKIIPFKLKFGK
jgi:hypothetical protein